MHIRGRYFAVAAAVPVMLGAAVLGTGTAHASISTAPTYTTAGTAAAAGWSVRSSDINFTHTQGRYGSAGNASWENLPVGTAAQQAALQQLHAGDSIPVAPDGTITSQGILGGIGQELCDTSQSSNGYAAQEGIVRVGPNAFDVIEAIGEFGPSALNSSGDVCDNGLLGVAAGSKAVEVKVLLTGVKANDTVDMNTLYNAKTNYTVYYCAPGMQPGGVSDALVCARNKDYNVLQGQVTFAAHDLVTGAIGFDDSIAGSVTGITDFITNEAAQGVVADTTAAVPLSGVTVPAPNGGTLETSAPSELVRVAHSGASGNSVAIGGHEVEGSFFTNAAWTATPVASTKDGTPSGALYLDPSLVSADNFYVSGGIGLVGGTS